LLSRRKATEFHQAAARHMPRHCWLQPRSCSAPSLRSGSKASTLFSPSNRNHFSGPTKNHGPALRGFGPSVTIGPGRPHGRGIKAKASAP